MKRFAILLGTVSAVAHAGTYDTLVRVNHEVNQSIIPTDFHGGHTGVADPIDHRGNCQDYARTKVAHLAKLGVTARYVTVAIVHPSVDPRHRDDTITFHAVVLVGDMVLDNLYDRPQRVEWLVRGGYRFPADV